ncbi:hypothetical protein ZIOFF_072349 [Zingiber officinale]|uniref:Uncharacterized protein n=1 Tax=Zingiber officinale TaxID=94328 RepID=A0A8J5EPD0_ZINOF|nr:hypothetical protein ZIOFF_072349 [Zingiber officinale]
MCVVGLELLIEETVKDAVADDGSPMCFFIHLYFLSLVNLSGQLHNRLINGFLYLWVHHLKIDLGLPNQLQDCTLKWSDYSDSSSLNQTGDPDLCLASQ